MKMENQAVRRHRAKGRQNHLIAAGMCSVHLASWCPLLFSQSIYSCALRSSDAKSLYLVSWHPLLFTNESAFARRGPTMPHAG